MEMLICKTANCGVIDDWAKRQGIRFPYTATPHVGDLVTFDFRGTHKYRDHIGIVVGASGDIVYTVEGNTSITSNDNGGAVMRRTRYKSQITSFIRPRYNAEQTAAKLVRIAESQVGVKEIPSGSNRVKYNTWYYGRVVSGSAYPWCCVFVEWCFAVLAGEIKGDVIPEEKKVNISVSVLRRGSTGAEVKTVQRLLNSMGYKGNGKALAIDGDFGSGTDSAVRAFQKKKGLAADGIVGSATWGALIG